MTNKKTRLEKGMQEAKEEADGLLDAIKQKELETKNRLEAILKEFEIGKLKHNFKNVFEGYIKFLPYSRKEGEIRLDNEEKQIKETANSLIDEFNFKRDRIEELQILYNANKDEKTLFDLVKYVFPVIVHLEVVYPQKFSSEKI